MEYFIQDRQFGNNWPFCFFWKRINAVDLLMVILVAGGLMALTQLNQEEFPDVELGIVQVSVPYLGAAPEEVEEGVCSRIEEALESAESIFRMTSRANEGNCTVTLEIEIGYDTVQALNEIKSKVDSINTLAYYDGVIHDDTEY